MPQVGHEVVLSGRVGEFFNLTQLSVASLVERLRTGVDLDAEVPAFETAPPDDLDEAERYWERREGMRTRLPAASLAVSGRDVFASSGDAEVWAIRGDHPVAQREDPFARRVCRDPHPFDNRPELFDDGNGYRIVLGSLGLKGATGDRGAILAPARTFDTVTNAAAGGVYFSFGKYQIQVTEQLALASGADPAANAPPPAGARPRAGVVDGHGSTWRTFTTSATTPPTGATSPATPAARACGRRSTTCPPPTPTTATTSPASLPRW